MRQLLRASGRQLSRTMQHSRHYNHRYSKEDLTAVKYGAWGCGLNGAVYGIVSSEQSEDIIYNLFKYGAVGVIYGTGFILAPFTTITVTVVGAGNWVYLSAETPQPVVNHSEVYKLPAPPSKGEERGRE